MTVSYFFSDRALNDRIARAEAARSFRSSTGVTPVVAQRMQQITQAYPHMAPGQVLSFAMSNIDIASDEMQAAADLAFDQYRTDDVEQVETLLQNKKGLGRVPGIVGGALGAVGRGLDTALGGADEAASLIVKPTVRTAMVVMDTGLGEFTTFIRNAGWAGTATADENGASDNGLARLIASATHPGDYAENIGEAYGKMNAGGSTGRDAVSALLRGDPVDLGSGWLPGGQIAEDVRNRAGRLSMKVGDAEFGTGHAITTGRAVAASVAEPGTEQYAVLSGLVDGAVAWFGDPAAAAGGAYRGARAGERLGRTERAVRNLRYGGTVREVGQSLAQHPGIADVARTPLTGKVRQLDRSLQSRAAERLSGGLLERVGKNRGWNKTDQMVVQPPATSTVRGIDTPLIHITRADTKFDKLVPGQEGQFGSAVYLSDKHGSDYWSSMVRTAEETGEVETRAVGAFLDARADEILTPLDMPREGAGWDGLTKVDGEYRALLADYPEVLARYKQLAKGVRDDKALAQAAREAGYVAMDIPAEVRQVVVFDPDRVQITGEADHVDDLLDELTGRLTSKTGGRNTVQPDVTGGWLTKGAVPIAEKIAGETNAYRLWEILGKKVPIRLVKQWAKETDPQMILRSFNDEVGPNLRTLPEFNGFKVKRVESSGWRMLETTPGGAVDVTDIDHTVEQMDRWLRNAKVTPELRDKSLNALIENDNPYETVDVFVGIMDDVEKELATKVLPRKMSVPGGKATVSSEKRARSMTELFKRGLDDLKTYTSDEIAENRTIRGVVKDGEVLDVGKPFLPSEYLNSKIPLPDAREIRRATSKMGHLVDNPLFEGTVHELEKLQQIWKQFALLRGAYTVRVVGEEQGRMAASGLDSLFAHPLSFIAALIADPNAKRVRRFFGEATGEKRQADVFADEFMEGSEAAMDSIQGALSKQTGGWLNEADNVIYDREYTLLRAEDDGFQRAWAQSIGEVHHDPLAREVARSEGNLEDVKEWWFNGYGSRTRQKMVDVRPELADRAGSDAYVAQVWELVNGRTAGDPDLLKAIATGRIGGAKIGWVGPDGKYKYSSELMDHLETRSVAPDVVKGQRVIATDAKRLSAYNQGMNNMFNYLMTKPTNYLSRSPTFRQSYWLRVEEQLPYMTDSLRAEVLASAKNIVDKAQYKRMVSAVPSARRKTILNRVRDENGTRMVEEETALITRLEDADDVAKMYALETTKKLLYDLTERSQFFDAARLVFPFGEAWKEVVTRWAQIIGVNPRVARRGQQIITAARGADPDGDGQGFFHKDANGEEVFTYPLSKQLSKMMVGVPVPLNARVAGLSLMTEVLPGVGPVVQVSSAAFLPDGSEWNWARDFINPYGETDYSNPIEAILPGWAKYALQSRGIGDERQRNNSVMQVFDYLTSTGEVDMSDPEDVQRGWDEARDLGSRLFMFQSMAKFISPSSPMPEYMVQGPNGQDLLVRREVLNEYHRLQDEYGFALGQEEFVKRFGLDLLRTTEGMTKSLADMLPVTKQASDWVRDHPDIVKKYPKTWGMFAPSSDTDSIDMTEYGRQVDKGDRVGLTLEQRTELANATVGRYVLAQQEKMLPPPGQRTKEQREWLDAIKGQIRLEYPGYGKQVTGVPTSPDLDKDTIPELERAIADKDLAGTDEAKAIREYLALRQQAIMAAEAAYGTGLGSMSAAPLRSWLTVAGRKLSVQYPSFGRVFDRVFAYELEV